MNASTGEPSFLRLEKISKQFGGTVALADFDWSAEGGEVHCLIGENGSGKSYAVCRSVVAASDPEWEGLSTFDELKESLCSLCFFACSEAASRSTACCKRP